MMFGDRLEVTLALELAGPLHIGSGISEPRPELQKPDMEAAPEVAQIQRDHHRNPIIPATTLKGALRAAATLPASVLDRLLGEQGDAQKERGRIGRLWLETAVARSGMGVDHSGSTSGGGTIDRGFVKTGVQIDRASGTAEDRKLYHREMVGDGTVFDATATLFVDGLDEAAAIDDLARLLAPLTQEPGLSIGGQTRQGGGRLRLGDAVVKRRRIDPATLDLVHERTDLGRNLIELAQGHAVDGVPLTARLRLTCEGPFISIRDKSEGDDGRETTKPLERGGKPILWPSSLLGALRTRAAWIAACAVLRKDDRFAPGREPHEVDRRNDAIRRVDEVAGLSSVERLFGVAGWRGLLAVASLTDDKASRPVRLPITSVTINRFTGGALDQRLFTEETFVGAGFVVDLTLEARGEPVAADAALLDHLLQDIASNGLELGHGAAKGFGWFEVAVSRPDAEAA